MFKSMGLGVSLQDLHLHLPRASSWTATYLGDVLGQQNSLPMEVDPVAFAAGTPTVPEVLRSYSGGLDAYSSSMLLYPSSKPVAGAVPANEVPPRWVTPGSSTDPARNFQP